MSIFIICAVGLVGGPTVFGGVRKVITDLRSVADRHAWQEINLHAARLRRAEHPSVAMDDDTAAYCLETIELLVRERQWSYQQIGLDHDTLRQACQTIQQKNKAVREEVFRRASLLGGSGGRVSHKDAADHLLMIRWLTRTYVQSYEQLGIKRETLYAQWRAASRDAVRGAPAKKQAAQAYA